MNFEKELQELIQAALEAGLKMEAIADALNAAATDLAEGEDNDEDEAF